MRVLYISPSPPPRVKGTDGLFTEIGNLRKFFGGDMISLSPARSLPYLIPVSLYGINQIFSMRNYNKYTDIFHLFFPFLANFRVLRYISKPIIYSIISGVDAKHLPQSSPPCALVVSSIQEASALRSRDLEMCMLSAQASINRRSMYSLQRNLILSLCFLRDRHHGRGVNSRQRVSTSY